VRNHTAPFAKAGPRAKRALLRDVRAQAEQDIEKYVRAKMQPQLIAAGRAALANFKRERGR